MITTQGGSAPVVVATSAADATAVEAVKAHHAELASRLRLRTEQVLRAAGPGGDGFEDARGRLVSFATAELLPHARAEEKALYPAGARTERARLLVESMLQEHRLIAELVDEIRVAPESTRAAASAYALRGIFDSHLAKENDLVLPVVAADPAVSLADVLAGMHELMGSADEPVAAGGHAAAHGHGGCTCGHEDVGEVPELDVRTVPHAIRHATVFGAFDGIGDGGSLVLVAPHDPLPLLRQLSERAGGALDVEYLDRGPEAWRLLLTRT